MLDQTTAQKLSKELKIDLFSVYREYLQILFLKYFYSQKNTEKIFFKGGTAIRLIVNSFRFSEDLDFTSLVKKTVLIKNINQALKSLNKEISEIEFKKEKTIDNSFSGRIFQKISDFKFPLTIRLDFSLREKPLNTQTSFIETIFPISPYAQVPHLQSKELLAEKIRAIFSRTRGRDIFDLWFLLSKKIPLDWSLINKKMSFYNKTANLDKLIKIIQNISQQEIKSDLAKFLPLDCRDSIKTIRQSLLNKLIILK